MSCKLARRLLSHEEHETLWVTHHPATYEHGVEKLQALCVCLRQMRDKERGMRRHGRNVSTAGHGGGRLPDMLGTMYILCGVLMITQARSGE